MEETIYLNRWDGNITNDARNPASNACRICTGFDAYTNPYKLTPYRSSESGSTSASTEKEQAFQIALRTGTTYSLYGLGVVVATGQAKVFYKNLTNGGTDLADGGWTETSNNASSAGATSFDLFIYYPKTALIYGAKAGTTVWSYDPSGTASFGDSHHSLSYTTIAQGLVHSKDDILYIPYDNKILKNDNGAWTDAALTLPTQYYITSICEFDDYLAIACAPKNGVGASRVFLWNRDTASNIITQSIDWGEGILKVIEEVEGRLVGISHSSATNSVARFIPRIIFRQYAGYGAIKFDELQHITTGSDVPILGIAKQKINNRIYFNLVIKIDGTVREGVWSVGPSIASTTGYAITQGYVITHERTPNNDTALVTGSLLNFIYVGDFLFQAYVSNGSNAVSKTDDAANYTATAIRQTCINPKMPEVLKPLLKQLQSVGATYESLPTAGQVVVQYRVDGGSFTTVFTETTDGRVYTEPFTQTEAGTQLPSGKDFEFLIKSTGGAEVSGLHYKVLALESNV